MTAAELEDRWNFDGLMVANETLDAIEAAEARARDDARRTP